FDPESLPVEPADVDLPAVAPERLTPDSLRARFEQNVPWERETREVRWRETGDPRVAAVLVALVVRDGGLTVLLTQR
ncbi:coenzyme A pyrophosphatase, partial [Paraburkholderia sp. SIMBA_061]